MFTTIRRSYAIFVQSLGVLRQDKEILLFPVLSGIFTLVAMAGLIFGGVVTGFFQRIAESGDRSLEGNLLAYGALFVWYFVSWFIVLFFNVGVVACARIRLEGGDPTVADGFRAARENLKAIVIWALISATVGLILRIIAERSKLIGALIAKFLGAAWAIATYFVVPVMIFEKSGARQSMKSSTQLISRTWGESLVAAAGVGITIMLLGVGGLAFPILGFLISPTAALIGLGVMVLYWLVLSILSSALTGIYRTGLYLYAKDGRQIPGFNGDFATTAFAGKAKAAPAWTPAG
jgi:ABC-type multidrug transport system fused ATPase/permease subunit